MRVGRKPYARSESVEGKRAEMSPCPGVKGRGRKGTGAS